MFPVCVKFIHRNRLFIESKQDQKQLAIKRTVGEHILKYGYCVYIDGVNTEMYPEQGPLWDWLNCRKKKSYNSFIPAVEL